VWLDFETFWADLSVMGREHVLAEQSHELSSFVYLWLHALRYGMGTVALCVFFLALLQKPRHWRREEAVLLVGLFVFAALLAMAESRYMRYALPMAPLLAVLVVRPFAHWQQRNRAVLAGALLFLLVEPAHTSLRMHALLNQQDTRAQFQQWLYQRWPNGQRLIFSPTRIRYRPPVNFSDQLVRQKCYINSFGATGLIRAYSLLSQRADLPPVYNYYSWERISAFVAAPGDGVVDTAIAVHHDHPLSVSEASVLRLEEMAGVISWQEWWNPGSFSDAVFDWQDAYYVPVAGWNDAERAGPAIEVGYLPLKNKLRILPTAREYFALVPLVLQAHQHMDRGEWAVSIERYESVLNSPFYLAELLPFSQYYIIYEDLAYAYEQMGNIDQSLYYWQQALELRPDQMHIYFNIGLIYISLNDLESALYSLHKAHELDTADPDILMNMGICYIELGQFAEGIDSLERRVALGADADAYIALGQAYGLAGRIGEQKVYYLRALELAPNHAQTE
jgi:tetratricopeptide (TPR) repeat protein